MSLQTEIAIHDAPDATGRSVEHLMQALVKAYQVFQLYPVNNPMYQRAIDEVRAALESVWDTCAELHLRVTEGAIEWRGIVVLSEPTESDCLSWVLFKDGIRSVTLSPGVEDGEIVELLRVIHRAHTLPSEAADDLLTLLWDADFQHVQYQYVELDEDDLQSVDQPWGWNHGGAPEPDVVRRQAEADAGGGAPADILRAEDFQSTLYFLDENDIAHLRRAVEQEYELDLQDNVLAKLLDLLELSSYTQVRGEVISALRDFIPDMLSHGGFRSVGHLLREAKSLVSDGTEWLPQHRSALAELPEKLSEPDVVNQLLQSLDDEVADPTQEELDSLFAELRPDALGTVLEWFAKVSNDQVGSHVHRVAERLSATQPRRLLQFLEGDDESLLLAALRVASWINAAAAVPAIGAKLRDGNVTVRRAAAQALAVMGTPAAMRQLEFGVSDKNREVRITAVRAIGQRKHRAAMPLIQAALEGDGLRITDVYERRVFFEAYAALAGASGVNYLAKKLRGHRLLRAREEPEVRACAAMALGIIGNDESRGVLATARRDRNPLVRSAVDIALSGKKLW